MARHLPSPPSADSLRGDRVHAWLHAAVTDGAQLPDLAAEEESLARSLHRRAERFAERFFGPDWWPVTGCRSEERLWDSGGLPLSGRLDRLYLCGEPDDPGALVLDFKSGWGHVAPGAENLQLRAQAVLAASATGYSRVTVAVVRAGEDVQPCTYDAAALCRARAELRAVLDAAAALDAPLRPSADACRYCPAATVCPALPREEAALARQAAAPPAPWHTYGAIASVLERAPVVERFIRDVRAEARRRIADQPARWAALGWGLRPGRSVRVVSDVAAVAGRLAGRGVSWPDITAACSIPLKEVSALLRRATGLRGADLRQAESEVLAGAVEVRESAPSLARVTPADTVLSGPAAGSPPPPPVPPPTAPPSLS